MARKLNPQDDRLLRQALLAADLHDELDNELLFEDIATKRDKELLLSPELLAFFEREFPLTFFR